MQRLPPPRPKPNPEPRAVDPQEEMAMSDAELEAHLARLGFGPDAGAGGLDPEEVDKELAALKGGEKGAKKKRKVKRKAATEDASPAPEAQAEAKPTAKAKPKAESKPQVGDRAALNKKETEKETKPKKKKKKAEKATATDAEAEMQAPAAVTEPAPKPKAKKAKPQPKAQDQPASPTLSKSKKAQPTPSDSADPEAAPKRAKPLKPATRPATAADADTDASPSRAHADPDAEADSASPSTLATVPRTKKEWTEYRRAKRAADLGAVRDADADTDKHADWQVDADAGTCVPSPSVSASPTQPRLSPAEWVKVKRARREKFDTALGSMAATIAARQAELAAQGVEVDTAVHPLLEGMEEEATSESKETIKSEDKSKTPISDVPPGGFLAQKPHPGEILPPRNWRELDHSRLPPMGPRRVRFFPLSLPPTPLLTTPGPLNRRRL
jgi:hypothetical protein